MKSNSYPSLIRNYELGIRNLIKVSLFIFCFVILSRNSYGQGANCSAAQNIVLNNITNTFTVNGAGDADSPSLAGSSCTTTSVNESWFKFTASTNLSVVVFQNGGTQSGYVYLYSGICGSLTDISCFETTAGNLNYASFPSTNGTVYYIRVVQAVAGVSGRIGVYSASGQTAVVCTVDKVSRATGTVKANGTITQTSDIQGGNNGGYVLGWAKFNTSAIPAGLVTVNNLTYVLNCKSNNFKDNFGQRLMICQIKNRAADPVTAAGNQIYTQSDYNGNGILNYIAQFDGISYVPGKAYTYVLNNNASSDFKTYYTQGWFTIGLPCDFSTGYLGSSWVAWDGWNSAYTPYLVVSYSGGCAGAAISQQPVSPADQCAPASANFTVAANGDAGISFKWQAFNGAWTDIADGGLNPTYAGTATATLNVSNATSSLQYRCVASNCGGASKATSNVATLTLASAVNVSFVTGDKSKCTGDSATFKVVATGTPLNYQWTKEGTPITGETNSIYTINTIAHSDSSQYSCIVSNSCDKDTVYTFLTVGQAPIINNTISEQSTCAGNPISFTVEATGDNLTYQWTKGGKDITDQTNSTYTLSSPQAIDYDIYSCKVSNSCTTSSLTPFILNVNTPPESNTSFIKQTRIAGDTVKYSLSPTGSQPMVYQWYHNGVKIDGATNYLFEIKSLIVTDSGLYTCAIKNMCDSINANIVHLIVIPTSRFRYPIQGMVHYDNLARTPITFTKVYLYNAEDSTLIDSTTTDNKGLYVFPDYLNGYYMLRCKIEKDWGGSNPADALIVNKCYVGIYKFKDPLWKMAADVNIDKKINSVDALMINRRFIGVLKKFTLQDWLVETPVFVLIGDTVKQDIKSECAGDVNGSHFPPQKKLIIKPLNLSGQLTINQGKEIDIPVYLNEVVEMGALGIKLKVKSEKLKIIGVKSDIEGLIYNLTDDGVNIAWSAGSEGILTGSDKPLFTIKAVYNEARVTNARQQFVTNARQQIQFMIEPESMLADIDANDVSTDALVMPKLVFSPDNNAVKFNNYPNPFSNITTINYSIPEDANVRISLYNIIGEKIGTITDENIKAGNYSIQYNASGLSQGIYYCRMEVNNDSNAYVKNIVMMISK